MTVISEIVSDTFVIGTTWEGHIMSSYYYLTLFVTTVQNKLSNKGNSNEIRNNTTQIWTAKPSKCR